MPLLKPFKIRNDHKLNTFALIQQHLNYTFLSTAKDCKDVYELRIYIPCVKEVGFSVSIEDHILTVNMHDSMMHLAEEGLRVFLPTDVNEEMVTARIRPYGIKILLPKKNVKRNGTKVEVPVLSAY